MSIFKKISSVLLCGAMTLSLASCSSNLAGADTSYAAVIDGYTVPAGVFINMQMNAYYDAQSYVEPEIETDEPTIETTAEETTPAETTAAAETEATETTPFTDKVIEGMAVEEWINEEATKTMQEFVAIEQKFDELGLVYTDDDRKSVTLYMDSLWEYYGEMYEELGISENSAIMLSMNSEKRSRIFEYYYGVGGEMEIPANEINQYVYDNNAKINYIPMELRDGEGNLLKSDGKAEAKAMAEGYIERINNGEDFNTVLNEYTDYYNKLVADAAAESTEITYNTEETDSAATEITPADEDNTTIVTKDSSMPSAAVAEKLFDGSVKIGDVFLVEEDEIYYIVRYEDILEDGTYLETNDLAIRDTLKSEEFEETVKTWTEAQEVVKNEAAYKRYKIEKFM